MVYLSVLLVLCQGCSTWKAVEPPLSTAPTPPVRHPERVRVVLRNYEAFIVHEPRVARDSLFGMREVKLELQLGQTYQESSRESCAIAMKDARTIEERKLDKAGTALLLIRVAVLIWFLGTVSSDTYYSSAREVVVAQAFPGAWMALDEPDSPELLDTPSSSRLDRSSGRDSCGGTRGIPAPPRTG